MSERSVYIWNAAPDPAGRQAKRDQLVGIGCTEVLIKGFGDQGVAWVEGAALPSFARPQWSDTYAADFAPLRVTLWGYPWPGDADIEALVRALGARWSERVVLNPETEWRYFNSNENPWRSLTEANAGARDWMQKLKGRCQQVFGTVPSFWVSSCPSWDDFPYEGFMLECDGALPEHYFPDSMMARGENMVEAHVRRAGIGKPCVPVVTACGEYDDQGVIDLGKSALLALSQPDGFSAWEAGNASFQSEAVRKVYAMLPADADVTQQSVNVPADTSDNVIVTPSINDRGEAIVTINFRGRSTEIIGINAQDIGVSTRNEFGEIHDRSVIANEGKAWVKRG